MYVCVFSKFYAHFPTEFLMRCAGGQIFFHFLQSTVCFEAANGAREKLKNLILR